jgi:site-specific DNA-methyltransferase (adenine-specific)
MKITDKLTITNEDNMALMARYPDNYFELAIVDPPYGINMAKGIEVGKWKRKIHNEKKWDVEIPPKKYFNELFRVSKNQIIWGGNYFIEHLKNTRCFIFWDKKNGDNFMSDGELAWTSFDSSVRRFQYNHIQEYNAGIDRIHPTQKPVALYKWLLDKYAKDGDKILDTHLGSGSIALACHDYGFELTACELDTEYYEKAVERIKNHVAQQKLF